MAMFELGKKASEAQTLIVEYVKSKQKAPLKHLTEAERRAQIKEMIKGRSWASVAAGNSAAEPKKAVPEAALVDLTKSNTLCRNMEENGFCRFGERCKFKHDRGRREIKGKSTKSSKSLKSSK